MVSLAQVSEVGNWFSSACLGSKHWPTEAQRKLWEWFTPLIKKILGQNIKTDTLMIWSTFLEVCRYYNHLMDKIDASSVPFLQAGPPKISASGWFHFGWISLRGFQRRIFLRRCQSVVAVPIILWRVGLEVLSLDRWSFRPVLVTDSQRTRRGKSPSLQTYYRPYDRWMSGARVYWRVPSILREN